MITGKQLKDFANNLADDALVGIEGELLIARPADSDGWENELEIGNLPAVDDDSEGKE